MRHALEADHHLRIAGAETSVAALLTAPSMSPPKRLELIGSDLAILWEDGMEDYIPAERLRAWSPSAETTGERDLLGRKYGGTDQTSYPGVTVRGWRVVGGYAVQFDFSDGHNTGLFSYDYLRRLGRAVRERTDGAGADQSFGTTDDCK